MAENRFLGLRNQARSPGSIVNAQHHDLTGSQKSMNGSPATLNAIIADSTVLTSLEDFEILRVVNTTGATAFFWHGRRDQDPGALTAANAFALPAGHVEVFLCGATDDVMQSMACKASVSGVQVARIKLK